MMLKQNSMRTPLAQVRGLGTAKSGLSHWWHQRLTAIALLGLVVWMAGLVAALATGSNYQAALNILAHPLNAAVVMLFVAVGLWHAALGLQVVFEDYISHEGVRLAAVTFARMILIVLGVVSIVSVLKIAL